MSVTKRGDVRCDGGHSLSVSFKNRPAVNPAVPLPVDDIVGVLEDIVDFIFGDDFDLPDSIDVNGVLVDLGQSNVPVTSIDVLNNTFALQFQSQDATCIL